MLLEVLILFIFFFCLMFEIRCWVGCRVFGLGLGLGWGRLRGIGGI